MRVFVRWRKVNPHTRNSIPVPTYLSALTSVPFLSLGKGVKAKEMTTTSKSASVPAVRGPKPDYFCAGLQLLLCLHLLPP